MSNYFTAPDCHGEPTLWRGEPDDPSPVAVLTRHQLHDQTVWDAITRIYPRRGDAE